MVRAGWYQLKGPHCIHLPRLASLNQEGFCCVCKVALKYKFHNGHEQLQAFVLSHASQSKSWQVSLTLLFLL